MYVYVYKQTNSAPHLSSVAFLFSVKLNISYFIRAKVLQSSHEHRSFSVLNCLIIIIMNNGIINLNMSILDSLRYI